MRDAVQAMTAIEGARQVAENTLARLEKRIVARREAVRTGDALAIGVGQLVAATFPGASRSGTTILAALVLGLSRPAATEFSFLLGVPTLLAAGAYSALKAMKDPAAPPPDWGLFAIGALVSAVTAFLAVKWLLRFIQTHTFIAFGWYRVAMGGITLLVGK